MTAEPKNVLLLIADISGYTRFMIANQTELAHSHEIVGALLEAIIAGVEIPLTIAKLEGDAVFLYLIKDSGPSGGTLRQVRLKLLRLFDAFSSTLRELATTRRCTCGACRNIEQLHLKVIAHSGTALVYAIAGGTELASVDVIVHLSLSMFATSPGSRSHSRRRMEGHLARRRRSQPSR